MSTIPNDKEKRPLATDGEPRWQAKAKRSGGQRNDHAVSPSQNDRWSSAPGWLVAKVRCKRLGQEELSSNYWTNYTLMLVAVRETNGAQSIYKR